jgi:hypothetical protein
MTCALGDEFQEKIYKMKDLNVNSIQSVYKELQEKYTGNYFDSQGRIIAGIPTLDGDRRYIYAGVMNINGTIITMSQVLPDGATIEEIIPTFINNLTDSMVDTMASFIRTYKSFGLRYSPVDQSWNFIEQEDLNTTLDPYDFSLDYAGDTNGLGLDASWLIRVTFNGLDYKVNYRGIRYTFESKYETRFYFDERVKVYDTKSGLTLNDQIKVLKINTEADSTNALGQDQVWFIYKNVIESDGYQSNRRILITFPDTNSDGVPDNPDLFVNIVNPAENSAYKFVYLQSQIDANKFMFTQTYENRLVVSTYATKAEIGKSLTLFEDAQTFYATTDRKFYQLSIVNGNRILNDRSDLTAYIGRQNLYFQYRHNSPSYRRIDPSPNNIMDLYILTKQYATDYAAWVTDRTGIVKKPDSPSSEDLKTAYGTLDNYKALSDTLVFNSSVFKPLFGSRANEAFQAKFKVVKNPNVVISDNDVKVNVINAINLYFDISNWDFGETFYFSELSAYLHNTLAPNIASIIIVPNNSAVRFGNLYQINAESNEILISAATVDDVEIISAITAAQLNQTLSGTTSSAILGSV